MKESKCAMNALVAGPRDKRGHWVGGVGALYVPELCMEADIGIQRAH